MKKIISIIVLVLLLTFYVFFLLHKADLTNADLGRHLKNGEMILKGNFKVLKTNFYSYTYPDFPFLNHHWLGGVIFYLVFQLGGFLVLHLFFISLSLITFLIFFQITKKESNIQIAIILSLLLIPLIAHRKEIRPEIFSYFFSALFFWILINWRNKNISYKFLFVLPFIEILWVNIHIYFFLGPAIVGAFLAEQVVLFFKKRKNSIKLLGLVLLSTLIATLFNPFGINGLLRPLKIHENYGYRVLENQPVWELVKLNIKNPNFLLFEIVFLLLVLSFVLVWIKNKNKFSWVNLFLFVGLGAMAQIAIRNFTLFSLFALPILAINIKNSFDINQTSLRFKNWIKFCGIIVFVFIIVNYYNFLNRPLYASGLGLAPKNNASAEFFKEQNISGPIFNNYDISGYLIYHLYSKQKVFVDNRPEAYPVKFFKDVFIPMQENDSVWEAQNKKYNFNVIFFSHRDYTPWGQEFLINRVQDDIWIPVFVDNYVIIFLKDNKLNKSIINKYKIPKNNFKIKKTQ